MFVGVLFLALGGYLFKDGRTRIYKIFMILGAGAGYFLFPIVDSIMGGVVPEEYTGPIGAALGALYAYSITKTAERALTTGGKRKVEVNNKSQAAKRRKRVGGRFQNEIGFVPCPK